LKRRTHRRALAAKREATQRAAVAKREADRLATDEKICATFGLPDPRFAFACGGRRKIAVDPCDERARKMLLAKGFRYFSHTQFFIYACLTELRLDVFFDIGTNYGECLFAVPFYTRTKIKGFEANPALHPYLTTSIAYNDDLEGVSVSPCAVAGSRGENVTFLVDEHWSGASSMVLDPSRKGIRRVEVETTTIDHEMSCLNNIRSALIKIDVEGFEPYVFVGAQQTNHRLNNLIYLIEFDSAYLLNSGTTGKEFFQDLSQSFSVYILTRNGLSEVLDYAELESRVEPGRKVHCDLVLVKIADPDFSATFADKILSRPFQELRRELSF
jgi:FkbM family methyltransferase